MQSTEHDSHDGDLYEDAKNQILAEVLSLTTHGDLNSAAVAVNAASRLLDTTPWTMWDHSGQLVITLLPADARKSVDVWSHGLARWVDTSAEVEQIQHANHGMSWSTIVVTPAEIIDDLRAQVRCGGANVLDCLLHDLEVVAQPTPAPAVERTERISRRRRIALGAAAAAVAVLVAGAAAARQAGAAELSPAYESAPGHGPSVSVACAGDGDTVIGVHPWDSEVRNFQIWTADGRMLVNDNVARGSWVYPAGTVDHVIYSGTNRFGILDADCAVRPTTTTTSTPSTTSTTATSPTLPPVTVTTQPPATTVPPAPSTTAVVPPNDPNIPLDPPPPVSTTWATTPPPADVPPATAVVSPPVSAGGVALTGGELPRTGGNPWALATYALGLIGCGWLIARNARTNRKES